MKLKILSLACLLLLSVNSQAQMKRSGGDFRVRGAYGFATEAGEQKLAFALSSWITYRSAYNIELVYISRKGILADEKFYIISVGKSYSLFRKLFRRYMPSMYLVAGTSVGGLIYSRQSDLSILETSSIEPAIMLNLDLQYLLIERLGIELRIKQLIVPTSDRQPYDNLFSLGINLNL